MNIPIQLNYREKLRSNEYEAQLAALKKQKEDQATDAELKAARRGKPSSSTPSTSVAPKATARASGKSKAKPAKPVIPPENSPKEVTKTPVADLKKSRSDQKKVIKKPKSKSVPKPSVPSAASQPPVKRHRGKSPAAPPHASEESEIEQLKKANAKLTADLEALLKKDSSGPATPAPRVSAPSPKTPASSKPNVKAAQAVASQEDGSEEEEGEETENEEGSEESEQEENEEVPGTEVSSEPTEAAKNNRLRRLCEKKPSGRMQVPQEIHDIWAKGGPERLALRDQLEGCGWQKDRGDVGGGISSKVDELRMDASSKGLAWLQEKVESMKRDDLQKVAAASGVSTRGQGGSKVALAALRNALVEHFAPQDRGDVGGGISSKVEELRMDASSKGLAWLREKVESMKRDDLHKVAAASGVSTRGQDGSKVALAELRNAVVEHFAPQDRGDVGGGISSKVEELRMDASSKGLAWLREKVESMKRDDLHKVAAASGVSTRGQDGSKVALAELRNAVVEHFAPQDRGDVGGGISSKVEELRMDASSKGIAWLRKKVESMNQTEQRKMAAAVALSTRGPGATQRPRGAYFPGGESGGEGVWFGEDFVSQL
ncbi:unnamed protein product [Cladocopium goreaui]|uniref:Uncharacterized protein n=1 Tax=Cladocopium goreaui TaxID=2562237 RepID=A0A9P1FZX3_9DINO|nr:unnamed protein product [Cladocopium goreaui]